MIFGFGERNTDFLLGEGAWTMWSHDGSGKYDDGQGGE